MSKFSALTLCGGLLLAGIGAGHSQTITNAWIAAAGGFWDTGASWSAGIPTNTHVLFITNAVSKNVIADSITSGSFPSNLSVVSLTLNAPAGATNSLFLANTTNASGAFVPLRLAQSLIVGTGGSLIITNGAVSVDGGGANRLMVNGFVNLQNGRLTATNPLVAVVGDGQLVVSHGLFEAGNVIMQPNGSTAWKIDGGTNRVLGFFSIQPFFAGAPNLLLNGGRLEVTNSGILLNNFSSVTVSNGFLATELLSINAGSTTLIAGGTNVLDSAIVDGPSGAAPAGILNVSGGLVQAGSLSLVENGNLLQSGGRIECPQMTLSGNGTLISGGSCDAGYLSVDGSSTALGQLALFGGTLTVTNGSALIILGSLTVGGKSPSSQLLQYGASSITTGTLLLGGANGTAADFNMQGGTVNANEVDVGGVQGSAATMEVFATVHANLLSIGEDGSGTCTVSLLGTVVASNAVSIGDSSLGEGVLVHNGGRLQSPSLHVGRHGTLQVNTLTSPEVPVLVVDGLLYCPSQAYFTNQGVLGRTGEAQFDGYVELANNWTNHGGWFHGTSTVQVDSFKTFSGWGDCSLSVLNLGTIEARSGDLVFEGPSFNNAPGSFLRNAPGAQMFVASSVILNNGDLQVNPGGGLIFSAQFTNTFFHLIDMRGGQLSAPLLRNENNATIAGFGEIDGALDNAAVVQFTGPSYLFGPFTNRPTGIIAANGANVYFSASAQNNGAINVAVSGVTFAVGLTNNGVYTSDASYSTFTDLVVGTNGYVTAAGGDTFTLTGMLRNRSTSPTLWNTATAALVFSGAQLHLLELAGADLGASVAGYANNFAWGTLQLSAGAGLQLQDGNSTPGGALYLRNCILQGGVGQISSIQGNGFNIYYDPAQPANAYLNGQSYPLTGGGALVPVNAAAPRLTVVTFDLDGAPQLQGLGTPYLQYTVMASTNLVDWSVIGTATALSDGLLKYEDVETPLLPYRFYRFRQP